MNTLECLTNLLSNHVDGVLDAAVRNNRDNGCIGDTEVLDSVDTKLGIDNTLLDVLGETRSTARISNNISAFLNKHTRGSKTYGNQSGCDPRQHASCRRQNQVASSMGIQRRQYP